MALSPEEEIEETEEDEEVETSTTYRIDFETGRLQAKPFQASRQSGNSFI
ncbi:hypothetical protein M2166_000075 [Bacillus sp. TBS-096]|nr:hypothetical protein [Bacillus sp. TBS-096]